MMKKLLIVAGVATFAASAPAFAEPGRGNHGRGHDNHQSQRHDYRGDRYRGHDRLPGYYGYANGNCPPGLAKKHNGCLPPGIARKHYDRGQRWVGNYGYQWNYNQIPYDWRRQYNMDPRYNYYYGDGYLYSVDPTTMLVNQVIRAIIR